MFKYSETNTLQSQILILQSLNNTSLSKLQRLKQNNQHWKTEIRQKLQIKISQYTSNFERILSQSYCQLMNIKNRIHLAYNQIQVNRSYQGAAIEIDKINYIMSNSYLLKSIDNIQIPFQKQFQLVQIPQQTLFRDDSNIKLLNTNSNQNTFYRTHKTKPQSSSLLIQLHYQNVIKSLTLQYQTLSKQYNQLVYRILNSEQRTLIRQIISEQKIRQIDNALIKQSQKQKYMNLRKILKLRKQSLNQMSGIIIQEGLNKSNSKQNFI